MSHSIEAKIHDLEHALEVHPYTRISVALTAMQELFQEAKESNLDPLRMAKGICRVYAKKFQSLAEEFSKEEQNGRPNDVDGKSS